jgi:hypothetical protein
MILRKSVFLGLLLLVFAAFGVCSPVNLSIVADNSVPYYNLDIYSPGAVEVGVEVLPKLELVGKLAYDTYYRWESGDELRNSYLTPGLGARYTFWNKDGLSAYGFGVFNMFFHSGAGDEEEESLVDYGLGLVYRLGGRFALLGEVGVLKYDHRGTDWSWTSAATYNNLGIRFYL